MNALASPAHSRPSSAEQNDDLLLLCSQTLLSGIASSILVLRTSGHIAFANKAAEAMIGRSSAELAGLHLSALFMEEAETRQPSPESESTTRRGRLVVPGRVDLPVRINVRSLDGGTGNLQGSVVTVEDMSDLLQMDEFVKQMLRCDPLTGLPREETLAEAMEAALMQLHTAGRSFALLELNLDQFRRIKESLGNDAASGALREVATRLSKAVHKGDVVSRNTADAFTILLTNCSSEQEALDRAHIVLEACRQPFRFGPYSTSVTASIGMSYSRPGTVSTSGFATEAELALRRCKAMGGNRVVSFEPSMADWHSHAVQMESQMQTALANEEFYVVYQPQVCCQTGRLIGVESLLRWKSPTSGLIMPGTFIPAAEESGLIVQLGEWCLRAAAKEVAGLQQQLGYPVRLAVNVSPKQIYSPGFKDMVRRTLEESGLSPETLELEITESLLVSHEEEAVKAINSLQELGISLAMDDFGMGFSNLSYINRFKIDRLKIDRSFISRCPEDHNSRMITTSLVFLAKSLGMEVVAEGVETEDQAALLAQLQCDLAQGYLYSRPTTAAEICSMATALLANASAPRPVATKSGERRIIEAVAASVAQVPDPVTTTLASQAESHVLTLGTRASLSGEAQSEPAETAAVQVAAAAAHPANGEETAPAPSRELQASFTAHTILVPPDERPVEPSVDSTMRSSLSSERRKQQRTAEVSLEPREPLCRPSRPKRIPGAMRIRWTAVPDSEPA
ncbi:putative bifunctional diguanylate cyclase/phosphodiesterase [Terriglobus aquaticus]|uniref:Bifunctional diguanylate cyclase/phosphodiesterase n=1 Tax=Terriglobus aquaticus TaxID=940139 RepID=A0ABW9KFJ6_9BACT|nr:GGDEF domain-containing phosphodiesterase [Terriglobus aquaticus]